MKCLLLADNRPDLLATLEPILKHWGYRVLAATNAVQAQEFLAESDLCLAIVGEGLIGDFEKSAASQLGEENLPFLILAQDGAASPAVTPDRTLDVPVDVFALFSFIQTDVEKHPRHNLRLPLRLPGMYRSKNDELILADVLSLSMQGLFFKATSRLKKNDRITVVFPLLGHCRELEIEGTVLYTILPEPGNNFMQGFGVGFDTLTASQAAQLQKYIEDKFLEEVSTSRAGVGEFTSAQLKS